MSHAWHTTSLKEVTIMANKDLTLNVRLDRIDEHYLRVHVQTTAATPSDIVRALLRHTSPDQCQQFLRLEGKAL
jgi:hypothetical protein